MTLSKAELALRRTVPPLGKQPADHEGAVDAGERDRGRAARRAAKQLGVFEAGGCSGSSVESGVYGGGNNGSGVEQGRGSVNAFEALDHGVCFVVLAAYGMCLC